MSNWRDTMIGNVHKAIADGHDAEEIGVSIVEAADAEIETRQERLDDWEEQHRTVMAEKCPSLNEVHCTCVPHLRAELGRVKRAGPPGEWRCDACDFALHSRVISAQTGEIGVPRIQQVPDCMNGHGPMRPVTWEEDTEAGNKTIDRVNELLDERDERIKELKRDYEELLRNSYEAGQRWEKLTARLHTEIESLKSDSGHMPDAREHYFASGGAESDIGPRDNATWYWRRAAKNWRERSRAVLKKLEETFVAMCPCCADEDPWYWAEEGAWWHGTDEGDREICGASEARQAYERLKPPASAGGQGSAAETTPDRDASPDPAAASDCAGAPGGSGAAVCPARGPLRAVEILGYVKPAHLCQVPGCSWTRVDGLRVCEVHKDEDRGLRDPLEPGDG